MGDHLRRAVHLVTGSGMPDLMHRVRWLFLTLLLLVLGIAALSLPDDPAPGPDRLVALAGLGVWSAWAWYRYRRPAAPWWTDAIPIAALVVVGASTSTALSVFGPSFVTLYFRSMYGTLRQAVANASLLAGAFLVVLALQDGVGAALTTGGVLMVIAYVAVGVVMQALGHAARQHQATMRYERTLADVSRQLLAARGSEAVHRVAADGALALVDDDTTSVSLWLGEDGTLVRAASGGADDLDLTQVALERMPHELLADLVAGRPRVLDGESAHALEDSYDHPHRFRQILLAPMVRDGQLVGGLVLATPRTVDPELLDVLERFVHEIALAVDRAELNERLEVANARLREADEMKNRFLSMVSHELRTPLTTIRGFTQTLRTQGERLTDEERDRFLEIIDRQGGHQLRMVEELLMTSQIVSGRTPVAPEPVAWREVIDTTLEELQVDPAHVRVVCPPTAVVHADPAHLHQVLSNLLTNAQKYGAPPLEIEVDEGEAIHTLRVRDHGPGVEPEFREYLFDPFRQAEAPHARQSSGVGLGLAIVEGLVRANGGTIEYVPADPGSVFEVRLPAATTVDVRPDQVTAQPG